MLLNVSYNNPAITKKIDDTVGPVFSLKDRWAMKGIGSPKLTITDASLQISNLLILDQNRNTCQIELRPKGIILRFRSLLETYALVIPFYKLRIYKGDFAVYSIYMDAYFVKVKSDTKAIQKFFKKILDNRANWAPTNIEDL